MVCKVNSLLGEKRLTSDVRELPERLKMIVHMVSRAFCVVDVGSDHGLVPLTLIEKKIMDRAIAVEVAEGPFLTVKSAFERSLYRDRLEARFGDGLTPVFPGEANTVVIAGMGGKMIWKILTTAHALEILKMDLPELILQPMEDSGLIRFFAYLTGYQITDDRWIQDRGLIYNCLKLMPPTTLTGVDFDQAYRGYPELPLPTKIGFDYGDVIHHHEDLVFAEFLQKEIDKMKGILMQLEQARTKAAMAQKDHWYSYVEALLEWQSR